MPTGQEIHFAEKSSAAMVAAALGDAMGWPYEATRRSIGKGEDSWVRLTGNRFKPVYEPVGFGEYSDDTQLLLCTARCILEAGPDWMFPFLRHELPAWRFYERGGGRATKAAVQLLVDGYLPWSSDVPPAKRHSYFEAGGNGGAMRVLPHAIARVRSAFAAEEVARDAALNVICTHGHPRAIIGAMVHACAAFYLLKRNGTLGYGELVDAMRDIAEDFVFRRCSAFFEPSWTDAAVSHSGSVSNLEEDWDRTVREVARMLDQARAELAHGAIASEADFLARIGGLDKKTNGAGTVSAVAAVFLASRYAVDPMPGLIATSRMRGLDTDTVASMTASLLAAVNGAEWMAGAAASLQDAAYIRRIGIDLARRAEEGLMGSSHHVSATVPVEKVDVQQLLRDTDKGSALEIPGLGKVRINGSRQLDLKGGEVGGSLLELSAFGGQTLFIRVGATKGATKRRSGSSPKLGVRFYTRHLPTIRAFYEELLGLNPESVVGKRVVYAPNIVFAEPNEDGASLLLTAPDENQALVLEVSDFEELRERLHYFGVQVKHGGTSRTRRQMLILRDPDGRKIEVFTKVAR